MYPNRDTWSGRIGRNDCTILCYRLKTCISPWVLILVMMQASLTTSYQFLTGLHIVEKVAYMLCSRCLQKPFKNGHINQKCYSHYIVMQNTPKAQQKYQSHHDTISSQLIRLNQLINFFKFLLYHINVLSLDICWYKMSADLNFWNTGDRGAKIRNTKSPIDELPTYSY